MKTSITLILTILASLMLISHAGSWLGTTNYPITMQNVFCTTNSSYVYCIGGVSPNGIVTYNNTYYAKLTGSGIGNWIQTTAYPTKISNTNCFIISGHIICLDGDIAINPTLVATSNSFEATINNSGIGNWIKIQNFSIWGDDNRCTTLNNTAYCLMNGVNAATFYANVSKNGTLSPWQFNNNYYPLNVEGEGCARYSNYFYCEGGFFNNPQPSQGTNSVYYTQLGSNGISPWIQIKNYQINTIATSCDVLNSYLYCIGGTGRHMPVNSVYRNKISLNGSLGNWTKAENYPINITGLYCNSFSSNIYCAGGATSSSYFYSANVFPMPRFSEGENVVTLYPTTLWKTPSPQIWTKTVPRGTKAVIIKPPVYDNGSRLWFYDATISTGQSGWIKETQLRLRG